MRESLFLSSDMLVQRVGSAWVATNPRLRTHVELDPPALQAIVQGEHEAISHAQWLTLLSAGNGLDRTQRGYGAQGLHADHSGLTLSGVGPWVNGEALLKLLRERAILTASDEDVLDRVQPLTGLLDQANLGTFHQRVGQYLLLDRRTTQHWREWSDQKFSPDGRTLLKGPYRQIQEPFFDSFFDQRRLAGSRILDFGCGNGYYTGKFAAHARSVVGLDNSRELLDIACVNHGKRKNLQFQLTESFEEVLGLMAQWGARSFDQIYFQDTLLLLLHPEEGSPSPLLEELFRGFRELLKPGGELHAMEPNPVFWLAGRYGYAARPFAVVTEYRNPVFQVAPTLDKVMAFMSAAGFALKNLQHPTSGSVGFSAEFPIWDFLTFVPVVHHQ